VSLTVLESPLGMPGIATAGAGVSRCVTSAEPTTSCRTRPVCLILAGASSAARIVGAMSIRFGSWSNPVKVFGSYGCPPADTAPVWAPNGTQVAYNACGAWVVENADGTGEAQPIDELVWRSWYSGGLTGWDLAQIGQVDH
jgi:hypothetical protein